MTLVQLGILLSAGVFFLAGITGFMIPFLKKKTDINPLLSMSWGVALWFTITLILAQLAGVAFGVPIVAVDFQYIIFLVLGGVLIMPFLYGRSLKIQIAVLFIFCLVGTGVLSPVLFGIENIAGSIAIRLVIALCWTLFVLALVELDRVPLEGFLLNMAFFLLFLIMSTGIFDVLSVNLFNLCLQILTLLLLVLLLFKRQELVWLGFPMMFVLTFIAGYIFIRMAVMQNGAYVSIMLSYPITETVLALGLNLFLYRRVLPLSVPFITERAFGNGMPVSRVLQQVFYAMLITGIIGMFGMRSSLTYLPFSLLMAVLVMYGLYIRLVGKVTKVSLKTIKEDAKMGWSALWREFKNVPLKKKEESNLSDNDTDTMQTTSSDILLTDVSVKKQKATKKKQPTPIVRSKKTHAPKIVKK